MFCSKNLKAVPSNSWNDLTSNGDPEYLQLLKKRFDQTCENNCLKFRNHIDLTKYDLYSIGRIAHHLVGCPCLEKSEEPSDCTYINNLPLR